MFRKKKKVNGFRVLIALTLIFIVGALWSISFSLRAIQEDVNIIKFNTLFGASEIHSDGVTPQMPYGEMY